MRVQPSDAETRLWALNAAKVCRDREILWREAALSGAADDLEAAKAYEAEHPYSRVLRFGDEHPEAFCDYCGCSNPAWCTSPEEWAAAVLPHAGDERGRRSPVLCPGCFLDAWREAHPETMAILHVEIEVPA